ncbi:hypothetical protein CQ10_36930 [Bradyrhizobium valentinum]|nr:hypothetical protein CQ10_36930 [Bradyrhizobium valentinum]
MKRTDLTEATMQGWARLDAAQRDQFFEAFVKAAVRLDRLELRAWLRRRLKNPPLAAPIDPASFISADADIASLLRAAGKAAGKAPGEATAGRARDEAGGG